MPESVLRQAQEELWDLFGTGIGLLEHSHRGSAFDRVMAEAEADCRALINLSDEYAVLFLQGGATLQFTMVPMNFLPAEGVADYPDTGVWTSKAIREARRFGHVNVAFDGSQCSYDHVPDARELRLSAPAAYLHYCTNNTIYGTQYRTAPASGAPIVADMSSDIFSRPMDFSRHSLVYAGAQKNLGPSGLVLVIARRDFLERACRDLSPMLSYAVHAQQGSRLNTPPTFAIRVMGLMFKWIAGQGGVTAMARRNESKAAVLYDAIDRSGGFYRGLAQPNSRSLMNVTFRLHDARLEKAFLSRAEREGFSGLKGHRDAGGVRASIYNAFPIEGCSALAAMMDDFRRTAG